MAQLHLPHMPHFESWDALARSHMSVLKLFLLYALPLSIVPPVMIYFSGVSYGGRVFPALSLIQLETIGIVFFIVELVMPFIVAAVVRSLGEVAEITLAYEDTYKLAVLVATPLWLSALILFVPSFIVDLTVGSLAMLLAGVLIFYNTPLVLKIEEKGHAILMSGSVLATGMLAWAIMMYLTLITWALVMSTEPV